MRTSVDSGRRGAVIIETALVTPLLLVILLGIVEMAFLMRDDAAVSSLVHQGVRTASSAYADHQDQSHHASQFCSAPSCSVDNAPVLADIAAAAIERSDASLSKDAIDELWIYKANPQGYPGASGNTRFTSCEAACVVYRWSPEHQTFDYVSGSWRAEDINACTDSRDTVGVYLKATHSLLTGLISRGIHISDHAVYSFAALDPTHCASSLG
jgi:hypothetical protein